MEQRSSSKNILFNLFLVGLPFLIALINFPYLLLRPASYLYGYPSDKLVAVWEYWWRKEAVIRGLSPTFTPDVRAPWGLNLTGDIEQWAYSALRNALSLFMGEVLIYNLLFLMVFGFSFLSLYFLVNSLLHDRRVGVVSGVIFSSSQYLLWHTMQNIEIPLAASFLPLYFFCLYHLESLLEEETARVFRKVFFVFGASLVFSLVFLFSFYLGYFAGLATLAFVFFPRLYRRMFEGRPLITKTFLLYYFLFAFLSFLLTLPGTAPLIVASLKGNSGEAVTTLQAVVSLNREADLVAYGARPWDYLLPSANHPLLGRGVRDFYQFLREKMSYQFWSIFLPERPNYLTFTALGLAAYAVWRTFRRSSLSPPIPQPFGLKSLNPKGFSRRLGEEQKIIFVWTFLVFLMFLVSLPAVITIRGINIYLPSFFLFKLFPMFRVYARAGIFVLLGVSVLAGYGWKLILDRINNGRTALVMSVGVVLLIFFENLSFPPFAVMDVGHVPGVYNWLRQVEKDALVVEYPKDNSQVDIGGGCPAWLPENIVRDYNPAYEFFYQRVHRKKLFGYNQLPFPERVVLGDLSSSRSYEILSRYGVDYVVVHTQDPMIGIHPWPYPQENPLDECWQRRIMKKPEKVYEKFKLAAEFEDGVIYRIELNRQNAN